LAGIKRVREALGDPAPTTGADLPPPTPVTGDAPPTS
jgi:hypothetical protein